MAGGRDPRAGDERAPAEAPEPLRLGDASYVVLGLIEHLGAATPYGLERAAAEFVPDVWRVAHTQLYVECARLARDGGLRERRERGGRRRRVYTLGPRGRDALERWRARPGGELGETRDEALLKLLFGADPTRLAAGRLDDHRERLSAYERVREQPAAGLPRGLRLVLDALIARERGLVGFWSRLA